jgi:hypothetical protein
MDLVKLPAATVIEKVRWMVHQLRRATEGQHALLHARRVGQPLLPQLVCHLPPRRTDLRWSWWE